MPETRTVVLYGNSVGLRSIGAFLKGRGELRIVQMDANQPDDAERVRTLAPHALLFDLAAAQPDMMASFFEMYPRLVLIGVNLATGTLLVLSGRSTRGKTMDELMQAIMG